MSVEYLNKAFDLQGVSSTQKLVLLALADRADQDGRCWPSYEDLVRRTCLNRKTVGKSLSNLVEMGHLEKSRRFSKSTVYRITISTDFGTSNSTDFGTSNSTDIGPISSTNIGTLTVIESSKEPSIEFNKFWEAYPKKKSKGQAMRAWRKMSANQCKKAIEDVSTRLQRDPDWQKDDGKYIPYPSTYLNGHSWEDVIESAVDTNGEANRWV